jgi:hypothetical protein
MQNPDSARPDAEQVLIVGANSHVGRRVANVFIEVGYRLSALARSEQAAFFAGRKRDPVLAGSNKRLGRGDRGFQTTMMLVSG